MLFLELINFSKIAFLYTVTALRFFVTQNGVLVQCNTSIEFLLHPIGHNVFFSMYGSRNVGSFLKNLKLSERNFSLKSEATA